MDKVQLCECLITWLKTFNISEDACTADKLTDGVIMSEVLSQISPKFFNEAWRSKIKTDASDNWRLKVSNLKKILKGIMDYNTEVIGQRINDFNMPDVNAIGERGDQQELGRLLQLILGVAVNCSNKQEYIQIIMSMEESVQLLVMQAIQELMTKEGPVASGGETGSELGDQLKRVTEELQGMIEQKDEYAQRCHELDMQVAALQEEKASLVSDNEKLNDRVNQADNLDDPSTLAGRRYQQLQNQVEQLHEELERLEAGKDDLRIKIELQQKEIVDLKQKNEELGFLAGEARNMKDEIDVLRHTSEKADKYEATIETYKKRLEAMSDLRQQLKLLEEKNTTYMKKNMELEEEVRKGHSTKNQLDTYKRQMQEVQMKNSEETKRADKAEFEANRMQEKLSTLQREKESLITERDSLKEMNEELRCSQIHPDLSGAELCSSLMSDSLTGSSDAPKGELGESGSLELMTLPPEVKEMFMRLQHENKLLKLEHSEKQDQEGELVQSMLDDANARKNELESENRIANQRILELEATVEDLQEACQGSVSSEETAQLHKQLTSSAQKISDLTTELQQRKEQVLELEAKDDENSVNMKVMEEQLAKKAEEMKAMEEKYRKYLDKAKAVIRSLNSKPSQGAMPEVHTLKNQLQEKERLIEHLQKEYEKAKNMRDQEERLVVTAWHNMGMQLHRKAVDERLANSPMGGNQSFLARQRQAHTARRTPNTTSPHTGPSR